MNKVDIRVKTLPHGKDLPVPSYATDLSAGVDLYAAVDNDLLLPPGEHILVPAGFSMALPAGYEAQVRPRSGLALKNSISVLNTPGTIDADYRGEVKIILVNFGKEDFVITRGMRVAQMVVAPVIQANLQIVEDLDKTERGEGGFGSTGTDG